MMYWLKKNFKNSNRNDQKASLNKQDESKLDAFTGDYEDELNKLKKIFDRASDIVFREFQLGGVQ
ncbi:hypothetical protein GC098_35975 [Paenibacillus sp. LMG 31458]|uniref:Uncharacterized protein n=1 Tax=Paenibacillus phytorum TaxID=2654977 RepID=A0ABX1Y9S2_9BACL|nr:hypothetical protein [Paenibacillus phytorum]NOU76700.1 hypothetical protein [Paenibacillus phytorum]